MAGLSELLSENRHVLKAIADAAPGDEDVEQAYRSFMHSYWIEDLTARIVNAQEQGLAAGLDPKMAGEALGWMAERLVTQSLERDANEVLDTIISIVAKCIFSSSGPGGRAQAADQGGTEAGGSGEDSAGAASESGAANGSPDSEETATAPGGERPDVGRPAGHRRATTRRGGTEATSS